MNHQRKNNERPKIIAMDAGLSIKIAIALAILTTLIFSSCSTEDEAPTLISSNDIAETIDENPETGTLIGTVTTNIPGTFSIISQNPSGAFSVDAQTGDVTIANASLFDFETNPMLEAVVVASDQNSESVSTVRVTLNNIDDIAHFLTDSKAAYEAAANGDWIPITGEEYIAMATQLNEVSKTGTTDAEYDSGTSLFSGSGNWMRANTTQPSIPTNSFLFAFKFKPNNGSGTGTQLKLSTTSPTQGYADFGPGLPANDQGSGAGLHYVFKGNNAPTEAPGFICIYTAPGGINGANSNFAPAAEGKTTANKQGNHSDLSDASFQDNWVFFYQGLSTTQKQWD